MAAHILAPIAQLNNVLLTQQVHATLFPYPLLSTLHAARIALVHQALSRRARDAARQRLGQDVAPTWAYDMAGFLIMCWGGSFLSSLLLGTVPPQLLSIHPFFNYVGVYVAVLGLLRLLDAPAAKMVDSALILIDGALRTHAVIMSINMAKASALPSVQNSLLIQIICGTLGATGGGQLGGMLGVHAPTGWQLTTPPVLRATALVEAIDVVAAAGCAWLYGVTTLSHPGYSSYLAKVYGDGSVPLFAPAGARAACTLVFAAAFAYRAAKLHWLPATWAATSSSSSKSRSTSPSKRPTSPTKRAASKARQ